MSLSKVGEVLKTFSVARHTARSAPVKALERLLDQLSRLYPGALPQFNTVAGFFPTLSKFVVQIAPEKLIIVVEFIIIMSRCLELIGTIIQTKSSLDNMVKPITTLLTGKQEIDKLAVMMQSICVLDENQKTMTALQIIFNIAMSNLNSYIVHPVEDEAYRKAIESLKVKLDRTLRASNINKCVANLKKGIPLSERYEVNTDDFGGRITGTKKRCKKKNKTCKRSLVKSRKI